MLDRWLSVLLCCILILILFDRLLKEMGWSDEHEPPLTEEEVLSAKRDIETHRDMIETKKAQSPTVLSPFPWVSCRESFSYLETLVC